MKRLYSAIFLLVSILILAGTADIAAQSEFVPTPVEISRNKVRIGDELFYEHQVKERQTLFSICKVYGVDEATIRQLNPGKLDNGLKTGSLIIIPVKSETAESEEKSITVTPQETAPDTDGKVDVKYINHRVKWYESLTTISLKYKVSQDEIMRINKLDSRTLAVNQVLRIPVGGGDDSSSELIDEPVEFDIAEQTPEADTLIDLFADDEPSVTPEAEEDAMTVETFKPFSGCAEIAMILPISAKNSPSPNFLNFYAGTMIGLNEIKEEGISVRLHVIDMADYDDLDTLLDDNNLEECDFVIGNFKPDDMETVASFCDSHNIPLISPLDQKIESNTYNHPCLINVPVSGETQIRNTIQQIDYSASSDNVVVIYETGQEQGAYYKSLCNMLDSLDVPFKEFNYSITGGRQIYSSIQHLLNAGKENHIFIASEKEAFATDAMRNIAIIGRGGSYDVTGYASHKVRSIDSIEPSLFNDANMHFCLGYYVDYTDETAKQFVRTYRALNNCEPDPFAFQGHDIIVYFTRALQEYGSRMIEGIEDYPMDLIQLKFKFGRRGEHSGMFNEATKNIFYGENLSIETL